VILGGNFSDLEVADPTRVKILSWTHHQLGGLIIPLEKNCSIYLGSPYLLLKTGSQGGQVGCSLDFHPDSPGSTPTVVTNKRKEKRKYLKKEAKTT